MNICKYVDFLSEYINILIDFNAESDTVVIGSTRDQVEVKLMYKGIDDLTYLFQNGDTVEFNYEGIKPIGRVLNREETTIVTNYSLYARDSIAVSAYMALNIVRQPMFEFGKLKDSDLSIEAFMQKVIDDASENLTYEVTQQTNLLSRLDAEGMLSEEQYKFRLQNILRGIQSVNLALVTPGKELETAAARNVEQVLKNLKKKGKDI